jgi:hypothetical protein
MCAVDGCPAGPPRPERGRAQVDGY